MAKWSVALFGHWKPRCALKDKKTHLYVWQGVDTPDYDAEADAYIVGATSFKGEDVYLYNVKGWEKRPEPGDVVAFKPVGEDWSEREKKSFLIVTIDEPDELQMEALCETYWDLDSYEIYDPTSFDSKYTEAMKDRCRFPKLRHRSRRLRLPLHDLESLGVDLDVMLNREAVSPEVASLVQHVGCYDKLNSRYVQGSDGLNLIEPLTDGELKTS